MNPAAAGGGEFGLIPMFGDWGTVVLQFAVTAVVILGLIGVVYWLVRRYSSAGLGRIGRGRAPRLAIMDAMSVDGRRRLVLVRRDNVEHLLLIGGPTDVVVEQAIQRQRRTRSPESEAIAEEPQPMVAASPATAPQTPAAHTPAAQTPALTPLPAPRRMTAATATNGAASPGETFSFRRTTPTTTANYAPPVRKVVEEPAEPPPVTVASRQIDLQRPTRIEESFPALPEPEPAFPSLPGLDEPDPADMAPAYTNGSTPHEPPPGALDQTSRSSPPSPYAKPDSMVEETRGKLADLENEMARLLGEITHPKRPS